MQLSVILQLAIKAEASRKANGVLGREAGGNARGGLMTSSSFFISFMCSTATAAPRSSWWGAWAGLYDAPGLHTCGGRKGTGRAETQPTGRRNC